MTELVVGAGLYSADEFARLPVGTVIGPNGGEEYVRREDGWFRDGSEYETDIEEFNMNGYNTILRLPKDVSIPYFESLRQWQFKYRDNAFMSAEQAGVSRHTVTQAMAELEIGDDVFPLGKGVVVGSEYDKNRLPTGVLVQCGQPTDLRRFGLFVKTAHGWTQILGDSSGMSSVRVTVLTGDEAAWATTPGTEAEQEALRAFKARAWRVGWKVKLSNRWCESYENYMARIGLTEDVLGGDAWQGIVVGERIGWQGAAALPVGSLLRWHRNADPRTFTWYIRDDTVTNRSRTRALFGHRQDGSALRNAASVMEVMWIARADEPMSLRIDNLADIWEHIPVGTTLRSGGTPLMVCHDHRLGNVVSPIPARGTWDFGQLGVLPVTGFPS